MRTTSSAAVPTTLEKGTAEKIQEKRRALGRGLESLLPAPRVAGSQFPVSGSASTEGASSLPLPQRPSATVRPDAVRREHADGEVLLVAIDSIDENPHQTRREFDETTLAELGESIRAQGVLQPIIVRPAEARPGEAGLGKEGRFTLILGERRLRAARLAGLEMIPAVVKRVSEQQAAEMTLVENLQRQDLNCVEQAEAFANLSRNFKLTQEEIGSRVGLSREAVANYMRLLTLPEGVIGALQKGRLTYSHARLLLQLKDSDQIWSVAQKAMEEKMSVAKLEDLVLGVRPPSDSAQAKPGGARWMDPNVKAAQRSLEEVLGMRVRILDRKGKGKIVIEYGTLEDFDRVVMMLKGKNAA